MMYQPKKIANFKIKYDNKIYDKITDFNISNWEDEANNVRFTNRDNDKSITQIICNLSDIEIIKE